MEQTYPLRRHSLRRTFPNHHRSHRRHPDSSRIARKRLVVNGWRTAFHRALLVVLNTKLVAMADTAAVGPCYLRVESGNLDILLPLLGQTDATTANHREAMAKRNHWMNHVEHWPRPPSSSSDHHAPSGHSPAARPQSHHS